MTLPASGSISWNQICAEFGMTPGASVWPRDFYGKGGAPSSGNLSFSDFYGRSNVTFNPVPGSYFNNGLNGSSLGVSASKAVVWTYSITGSATATVVSGGTAAGITFSNSKGQSASINLTATVDGQSYSWDLTLGNIA